MKMRYFIISIIIFLVIITSFRILWTNQFKQTADEQIVQGEVDLRNVNINEKGILLLDGEWEFYPNQWIMDEHDSTKGETKFVKVPDGWNEHFSEGKDGSYGFGSYRLQLLVDPEPESNYSIFFPSIRSASKVYVNGKLLSQSGVPGESFEQVTPQNTPQHITFAAPESGLIEVVVQVSNFHDVRRSGIIRSVKFGSEIPMTRERNLSISIQAVAVSFFILHAIYAVILFILGNREKQMLYFSIVLLSLAFVTVSSTDEKIFHLLINIPYTWEFRLTNSFALIAGFALLHSLDHKELRYWRQINPIITVIFALALITLLVSSPTQIISLHPTLAIFGIIIFIIILVIISKRIYDNLYGNILLLFALLASMHSFIWTIYWREIGISVIHYPFDLIIAIICFSAVWFKDYFDVHAETKNLAFELEKVNKNKDRFLAQTSHEFKNPLHGIINLSQAVLHREKSLQQKSAHELSMIRSVGRRLSLLLNDLLDDASLRDGQPRLNKQIFELQAVTIGVVDLLRIYDDIKRVEIINEIPRDFPPLYGDKNRVTQIVYNLLHNAIKFTDQGQIIIKAEIGNHNKAIIRIQDTGEGMDQATIERIFLPFEQIDRQTILNKGYGLGLNISKQLIELHGGYLEVESKLGEGSTFTFALPLASSEQQAKYTDSIAETSAIVVPNIDDYYDVTERFPPITEAKIHRSTGKYSLINSRNQKFNLLVIDDDPINLTVMESILSGEFFSVTTVSSGKAALKVLDTEPWDLVISDVMMPEMSGLELTQKIRERFTFTDLPILLLTARSEPQDIHAGFIAGANDYVTKPVEYLELTSRVNALIAIKNAVQEQLRLKSAWLQAQIQPHFLFNTLNSIISLSTIDTDRMNHLLIELSDYLRSKFQFNDIESLIPLQEELSIVKSYLNIEKVRFEDRLKINWEVDHDIQLKVPFLSIQPLVENAIHHGIMQKVSGGEITIRVAPEGTDFKITVMDNGIGMDQDKLTGLLQQNENNGASIGLINTNQRLMQHFGTGLHIDSRPNQGTSVSFTVKSDPQ